MFIQTEVQPNQAQMKFLPGRQVLGEGTLDLHDRAEAARSPLASHLFEIQGVAAVQLGTDFIIITKNDSEWPHLKPAILGTIMQHFMSGAPVLATPAKAAAQGDIGELAENVRNALRQVIDPELGYNIVDLGLVYAVTSTEGGAVEITMTTTTRGCPATNYLQDGAGAAGRGVTGVSDVEVVLTYDPPWQPGMMNDEAKQHFGIVDEGGW
jgi:metal-sulfur cluster biosynthetic enzyme